jgi:hypothetical protein
MLRVRIRIKTRSVYGRGQRTMLEEIGRDSGVSDFIVTVDFLI